MNNTSSFEQISKAGNLHALLVFRQQMLDLMARFMEIKSIKPRMKRKEIAKELGYSNSTLQRYAQDI